MKPVKIQKKIKDMRIKLITRPSPLIFHTIVLNLMKIKEIWKNNDLRFKTELYNSLKGDKAMNKKIKSMKAKTLNIKTNKNSKKFNNL